MGRSKRVSASLLRHTDANSANAHSCEQIGRARLFRQFSQLRDFAFDYQRRVNELPIFKFPVESLEVLSEPLDFYAALHQGCRDAKFRIVFSSLYWGTGEMEEFLVGTISQNLTKNENLKVRVVMDAYRGLRMSKTPSESLHSFDMMSRLKVLHINRDVDVGLYRMNPPYWFTNSLRMPQLNELNGVHHMKFAVFDNSVILTG